MLPKGETEVDVEYRDTVGKIDYWNGEVLEIKSVKGSQFKWLSRGAKDNHKLQAGLYALAKGMDEFTIAYVTADDFRVITHTIKTEEVKADVDNTIDEVYKQLEKGVLPEFKPKEKWQENTKYSNYPDWIALTQVDAMRKLELQYPDAYKKLKEWK